MEKSVEWEFDTYMQEIFQMKEVDIKEYSPLTLAYIGDCIYDLIIKTLVINEGIAGEEPVDHRLQTCDGIRSPAWLSVSEKRVEKNAGTG